MSDLYDPKKMVEFFENGEQWKDAQDEITLMHMNLPTQTILMGRIIAEMRRTMLLRSHGALSILDVGCGTGMLLDYIKEEGIIHRIRYDGLDIVDKYLLIAEKRSEKYTRPVVYFHKADIFAGEYTLSADIVVASQCLNTVFTDDQYGFLTMAIQTLWEHARHVLIFDLKDIGAPQKHAGRLYYDPARVYEICRSITQNVTLEQMTKSNFSISMRREELF